MSAIPATRLGSPDPAMYISGIDLLARGFAAFGPLGPDGQPTPAAERLMRREAERAARVGAAIKWPPDGAGMGPGAWHFHLDLYRPDRNLPTKLRSMLAAPPAVEDVAVGKAIETLPPDQLDAARDQKFVEAKFAAYCRETGARNKSAAWGAFVEAIGGRKYLRQLVGYATFKAFCHGRQRAIAGDFIERRGAHAKPKAEIHADDWAHFVGVQLNQHRVAAKEAWRLTEQQAHEAGRSIPGYTTMLERYKREILPRQRRLAREGEDAYRMAEAKIANRERPNIEPATEVVLDVHVWDGWFETFSVRRSWHWIRPVLAAICCRATGFPMGAAAGKTATAELAAAAHIDAITTWGGWQTEYTDQGVDFKALLREGGMKKLLKMAQQAEEFLGIRVVFHQKHTPWAKPIESWFRNPASACRLLPTWSGNFAHTKPDDIQKRLRQYHGDPQFSYDRFVSEIVPQTIETWRNTPSEALGGLSPLLAFEQGRRSTRVVSPNLAKLAFSVTSRKEMETRRVDDKRGVEVDGEVYGEREKDLLDTVRGQRVGIIRNPFDIGTLTLVNKDNGRLIGEVTCPKLSGYTLEEKREMYAERQRHRKADRVVVETRGIQMTPSNAGRLALLRAKRAKRKTEEARKLLPPPPELTKTIVAPLLAADADRVAGEARKREQKRALQAAAMCGEEPVPIRNPIADHGRVIAETAKRTPAPDYSRFAAVEADEARPPVGFGRFADLVEAPEDDSQKSPLSKFARFGEAG